jgi:adenosylhomocysteine nucleosidase
METIGIIAAMSQERHAVLHLVQRWERTTLGSNRCQRFQLAERDCWLLMSGMGTIRVAQAMRALIDASLPDLLVSVGVAGAVNADLEIGDVVASRNTCLLNQGVLDSFQSLAHLSDAAWRAAEQALQARRRRLLSGTAVTTRGSQWIQARPGEMTNPVLEMETAGIAQIAVERGIPLLSLRAISDGPRSPIPFDLEAVMGEQYNLHYGEIIKRIFRHPLLFPLFLQMGRNTRMAAENAAMALIAILSQPEPVISP